MSNCLTLKSAPCVKKISCALMRRKFPRNKFPVFQLNDKDPIAFLQDDDAFNWIRVLAENATDGRGILLLGENQSYLIPASGLDVCPKKPDIFVKNDAHFTFSIGSFLDSNFFLECKTRRVVCLMRDFYDSRRASIILQRPDVQRPEFALINAWYDREKNKIEPYVDQFSFPSNYHARDSNLMLV